MADRLVVCCGAVGEPVHLPAASTNLPPILPLLRAYRVATMKATQVRIPCSAGQPLYLCLPDPTRHNQLLDVRWEALYPRVVVAPCLARVERADDLPHLGGRQLVEAANGGAAKGHEAGHPHRAAACIA